MRLEETSPRPLLSAFVECYWYVEMSADESSSIPDAILPNGTSNLIFNLSGFPHHQFDDETLAGHRWLKTRWLSGIRDSALIVGPTVCTRVVGIRFKPGGLAAFADVPSLEVSRSTLDPDDLWGRDSEFLHEQLIDAISLAAQFELLEQWLIVRFGGHAADRGLLESLKLMDRASGNLPIAQLARAADLSPRQFRRRFERAVGITPKRLARVLRFRKLISRLVPPDRIDWAAIAFECGYFDQAHLIADFRDFAGVSPGEYIRRQPLVPGFMPINEPVSVFSNTPTDDSIRITTR